MRHLPTPPPGGSCAPPPLGMWWFNLVRHLSTATPIPHLVKKNVGYDIVVLAVRGLTGLSFGLTKIWPWIAYGMFNHTKGGGLAKVDPSLKYWPDMAGWPWKIGLAQNKFYRINYFMLVCQWWMVVGSSKLCKTAHYTPITFSKFIFVKVQTVLHYLHLFGR